MIEHACTCKDLQCVFMGGGRENSGRLHGCERL